MAVVICPRCKGKGEIIKVDWFSGIVTLGITILSDISSPITCPICNGKGVILKPRIESEAENDR